MEIKCKICNSEVESFFVENRNETYYKCNNCDFIFIDDKHLLNFNEEVKIYENHQNTIENEGYVNMFEKFIAFSISPFNENIKNILEFGSGPGPVLSELLKRKGYNVDIYDPYYSPEKTYENNIYDAITSTEVFEHFINPYEEIKLITKHLKVGGILAIMTMFIPETDFSKWWYKNDPTHISFYNKNTFNKIAEIFNLKILDIDKKNICVFEKL